MRRLALVLMVILVHAGGASAAVRFHHGPVDELPGEAAAEAGYLARQGCFVEPLTGARLALFREAERRIAEAARDGELRAVLRAKPDWVLGVDDGWTAGAAGQTVEEELARLSGDAGEPLRVEVLTYGRDSAHRCATPLGEKGIHAYSRPGKPFVVLRADYLDRLLDGVEGPARLAGTVAHEVLHVLGHAHPNGLHEVGGHAYANSVPVFVGCALAAWPDVDDIASRCRATKHERRATVEVSAAPSKKADERPASREPAPGGEGP